MDRVNETDRDGAPPRAELRRSLRPALTSFGTPPLRLLVEGILGEEDASIDWVAARADGQVVVGILTAGPARADLLAAGLVQRAWVGRRLGDFCRLAPGLGVDPERAPFLLLVASHFDRWLRLAAREADPRSLWLARYDWRGSAEHPALRAIPLPAAAEPPRPDREIALPPRPAARFETALSNDDLDLSAEEIALLTRGEG